MVRAPYDTTNEKGMKKKIIVLLPIHVYMKMEDAEIKKMDMEQLKVIKALCQSTFTHVYKWGKKHVVDKIGEPICIHFNYLHKALFGRLVYRGIQEE